MRTELSNLIVFVFVVTVLSIALGWAAGSLNGSKGGPLGKFFNLFWGWADYKPQDWSNAPYKLQFDQHR
jgi:hypothetical protein